MAHQAKADGTTAVRPTPAADARQAILRKIGRERFDRGFTTDTVAMWVLDIALLNWEHTSDQLRQWVAYRDAEGFTDSVALIRTQLIRKAAQKGGRK